MQDINVMAFMQMNEIRAKEKERDRERERGRGGMLSYWSDIGVHKM